MRNKFMNGLNVSAIMICLSVTFLNQYVTHCNSKVWLAGEQYNLHVAEVTDRLFDLEMCYAEAIEEVRMALSLADSERIRAEKLQYERDEANDLTRRMRLYIFRLHQKCHEAGLDVSELQKSASR